MEDKPSSGMYAEEAPDLFTTLPLDVCLKILRFLDSAKSLSRFVSE
jgi:hypothetical protein